MFSLVIIIVDRADGCISDDGEVVGSVTYAVLVVPSWRPRQSFREQISMRHPTSTAVAVDE